MYEEAKKQQQTNRKPEREYLGKSEKDAEREEGRQRVRGVTPHSPLFISSCRDGTNPSMYWLVGGLRVRTRPATSITSGGDGRFRVPFKDKPTQMDTWPVFYIFLSTLIDRCGDRLAPVNCGSPAAFPKGSVRRLNGEIAISVRLHLARI